MLNQSNFFERSMEAFRCYLSHIGETIELGMMTAQDSFHVQVPTLFDACIWRVGKALQMRRER